MRRYARTQPHAVAGEKIERLAECLRAPEVMLQAPAPARWNIEVVKQSPEQAEITDGDPITIKTGGRDRIDGKLENRRFGSLAVIRTEPFDPGLAEFAGLAPICREAKGRAAIAVFRLSVGCSRASEMIAAGRHSEIGPQA